MLLDGHHLDAVVSILSHSRQHVLHKLPVATHLLCILRHSHMALINEQRSGIGFEAFLLHHIGMFGMPHLCREDLCLLILHHSAAPCRDTLSLTSVPLHLHLIEVSVSDGFLAELQFPVACSFYAFELVFWLLLPVVEISDEENLRCVGCPLSEHPSAGCLVQTEILVSTGKLSEGVLTVLCQFVLHPLRVVMSATDSVFKGFKPAVVFH